MDLRKLKTLIDLVAESDISELEVTEGEGKVRIVKSAPAAQGQVMMMQPQLHHAMPAPAAAPVAAVLHCARLSVRMLAIYLVLKTASN